MLILLQRFGTIMICDLISSNLRSTFNKDVIKKIEESNSKKLFKTTTPDDDRAWRL